MEFDKDNPMTDEQLSELLKEWKVGGAPAGLEARVMGAGPRRRTWVWISMAACGAAAAGIAVWVMRPAERLEPKATVVVEAPAVASPAAPVERARAEQSGVSGPAQGQQQSGSESARRHEHVDWDLFFGPPKASPLDAKPAPLPEPQQSRAENSLPAGVSRVGNGVGAPSVTFKRDPDYSEEARIAGLSGTVLVQIVVAEDGSVRSVNPIRPLGLGLDEKAMGAVMDWRFKPGMKDGSAVAVQASIEMNFRLLDSPAGRAWHLTRALFHGGAGVARPVLTAAPYPVDAGSNVNDSVRVSFEVDENGVPINFHAKSQGNPKLESEGIAILSAWRFRPGMKDGKPVTVPATFDFNHASADANGAAAPGPIRVEKGVASGNVIDQVVPQYPKEAKAARIQGVVSLGVRIAKDGHVSDATVISGDPILAQAAVEAVRQWLYRPTLLNGSPVEVETTVDVSFTLSR